MQQIIQHLTKEEVRQFRFHLKAQNKNELLALFNLLQKSSESFTEKQMEERIYGLAAGGRRASMLRYRLKETLLDFIVSDRTLEKHSLLDKKFIARIRIKKRLAQYTMLYNSGRNLRFTNRLLDDAIADAKKVESYYDLIYALDQKKLHYGFVYGEKEYEKWQKEIEHYEYYLTAMRRAVNYYYKLIIYAKFNGNPDKKKILKIVKEGLKEMKRDYALTKLPGILYYRQILETEYYFQHCQYKLAKRVCLNILDLLQSNPSVNSTQRTGYAHDFLAQCCIFLKEYEDAREHLVLAQKNIAKGTADYLISKEQDFLLLFYDGQYEKSKKTVEILLKNFPADADIFRKGKLNLFLACALLKLKKYSSALKILNQKTEVFKDKAGWLLSSKLAEVMVLYEMKNPDEIKSTFKRLRDFVRYNKKIFTKRDKALLRLLYLLVNCNFIITGKNKKDAQKLIALLKSNHKTYQWQPFGHELIRFEDWVQSEIM